MSTPPLRSVYEEKGRKHNNDENRTYGSGLYVFADGEHEKTVEIQINQSDHPDKYCWRVPLIKGISLIKGNWRLDTSYPLPLIRPDEFTSVRLHSTYENSTFVPEKLVIAAKNRQCSLPVVEKRYVVSKSINRYRLLLYYYPSYILCESWTNFPFLLVFLFQNILRTKNGWLLCICDSFTLWYGSERAVTTTGT